MKRIAFFAVCLFSLASISGCQKQLDLKPHEGLPEEQLFKDVRGFEYAVRSLYTGMKNNGFAGQDNGIPLMGDLLSDNLMFNPAGRQSKSDFFKWQLSSLISYDMNYYYCYRLASRANVILRNIDRIPAGEDRDNFEGQALAMRGLAHLELLRWFAKIPTQSSDAPSSLGIYYQDEFNPALKEAHRAGTTVSSSYQRVVADLLAAADKIAESNPDGYLTKQSVYALLTRAYLYMGDYAKVVEFADKAEAGAVKMAKKDQVKGVWVDANRKVSAVIRILIQSKDRIAIGNPYSQSVKGKIKSEFVCRKSFRDLFQATDVRAAASFVESPFNGKMYIHVAKYLGRAGENANVSDYKYMRIEEVILSKAEAYARLGQDAQALNVLNTFRAERYEGFTPGSESGQALLDAILLERRLELAFEGDRFFTLKRLGLGLERDGVERELADGTGSFALAAVSVPATDHRWVLAIPQDAINLNKSMEQNPGY